MKIPCYCGSHMIPHHNQWKWHEGMTWLVCASMNCENTAMVKTSELIEYENQDHPATQEAKNSLCPANNSLP